VVPPPRDRSTKGGRALNWSPDDPRRFAIRLDAEAMTWRARALLALYESDGVAAADAFQRAVHLMHAASWAAANPATGLDLCRSNEIFDVA
jgi:hypothetical protein